MNYQEVIVNIRNNQYQDSFEKMYGKDEETIINQKIRYINAIETFEEIFPDCNDISIFSAPGRTEICGNHTDHQRGQVLAAAINLDAIAVVSFHEDKVIRIQSAGYEYECIDLKDVKVCSEEIGTTRALIKGMVNEFLQMGVVVHGFNVYITSDVLSGSGLSSSAAFEVLIGNIIDLHYNGGRAGAVEIAKMGQIAENTFFGKKSGLMDQMVSSVGGFVHIDFSNVNAPIINKHECDFAKGGYKLIITDTKGSHADLTEDYISVPLEMKQVAKQFGKEVLNEVKEEDFYSNISELRKHCSDRAILRAAHYFGDNARVKKEVDALIAGNYEEFLRLIRESGNSSALYLQNWFSTKNPGEQAISLAIMVSEQILTERGAARVHGGGFAGTIQAFVPDELVACYIDKMCSIFGSGCCYSLNIRSIGGCQLV